MIEKCNVCGGNDVQFESNSVLYGYEIGDNPYLYLCHDCGAYVGVHKGTRKPLGTLADGKTRKARIEAHTAFDSLWKNGNIHRKEAYAWLAGELNIDIDDCHIGGFDVAQCQKVIRLSVDKLSKG